MQLRVVESVWEVYAIIYKFQKSKIYKNKDIFLKYGHIYCTPYFLISEIQIRLKLGVHKK